ncbi:hypothetical protein AB0G79_13450 [Streptomyces sp. NPDC020807]|uniref:hypothetical protein n=1 Tax=Streptomyces sp. NPDC020807 TaxID=3155119 RepID=UPI00340CCA8E
MRSELRSAERGLRALLNTWDPIGVADEVRDEYDCMIGPLLAMLRGGADPTAIAAFLRRDMEDHFGLGCTESEAEAVTARLTSWWATVAPGEGTGSP